MALLKQSDLIDMGIDPDHAEEWLQIRKEKLKLKTLSGSAWKKLLSEARLAGITPHRAIEACCENGWAGFKAEWYLKLYPIVKADSFIERHTDRSWREGLH